jgi:MFS transporter, ACS family, hexuronate transporter
MTVADESTPDRRRWFILALLFVASVLNYFDRQTLSILKPTIKAEFALTDSGYSTLLTLFMAPYIVMYVLSGVMVGKVGSRISMSVFVGVWSLATAAAGFAKTFGQLGVCRFVLGIAEPGNWTAGIRALSLLFSPSQRGFAVGVFSAGSALGSILAPPLIAWMTVRYGWRSAFWIPGVLGLFWVAAWWFTFRKQDDVAPVGETAPLSWRELFQRRALWGLLLARLISDPVWYFYLFWIPGYFQEKLGLSLTQAGAIGWIPFLAADLGGVGTSSLSDWFVRRGLAPVAARKRVLFAAACFAPLGIIASHLDSTAGVLVIFSVVGAMCLTWTFNTATLVGDLFPKNSVGTVMGIIGAAGATGALVFNSQIGAVIDRVGYGPAFMAAALLHPVAAVVMGTLVRPPKPASQS